jgi:isoaspartyl peptidase/L-asparaginase-like protein (Ntn-hydrolase superfamily)
MTIFLATWREPGEVAVREAWKAREAGGDLRTCLEKGLAACELDEQFLAIGRGSLPNSDGELELDASMMDGADLNAGAVCGVRGIVPAISIARMVMEDTPHVMLAGEQARRYAISRGMKPDNLMTAESIRRFEHWKSGVDAREYVHSSNEEYDSQVNWDGNNHGDTVTMIGYEDPTHFVSASATSGLAWKLPGRVGDSPIVGAGIYADDEMGAAGATGLGEELWKACASFRVCQNMRAGMSAQQACDEAVLHMIRRQPASTSMPCVVFALDKNGQHGAATTEGEFPLWICRDGEITMQTYAAIS